MDRRPEFLDELREYGRTKCRWFLRERLASPPVAGPPQQSTAI
jgi:hypothetical protein